MLHYLLFYFLLGYYANVEEKIKFYYKILRNKIEIENNTLNIRLAGDGTIVARPKQLFNFTFGFVDSSGINPNSEAGNFLLGLFEIESENYKELKECLSELVVEISHLKEIEVENKKIKLNFFLAGDMKFLLLALGLNAANSRFPCAFCLAEKKNFRQFEALDISQPRNIGDLTEKGQKETPIFPFIKSQNVVNDLLHMTLRIAGVLLGELIKDLNTEDAKAIFDRNKQLVNFHMLKFINFLSSLNIKRSHQIEKDGIKVRSFNGVEIKKIFEKINLEELFPDLDKIKEKQSIFKAFLDLINQFNQSLDIESLKSKSFSFGNLFIRLYKNCEITPYIHILINHLPQQANNLLINGLSLSSFKMEGLEKLNDCTTKYFHRSTNKSLKYSVEQVFLKRNRVELFQCLSLDDLVSIYLS